MWVRIKPRTIGNDEVDRLKSVGGGGRTKLQALVYDIFPSTTAVFSYAIGSRKLSANEQFFVCCCWCSNSTKFVTNSNKTDVSFIAANKVYTSSNKTTVV